MSAKSVPLSVRITPDDAEFLARLRIDQTTTPSEKLRALVGAERRRREGYRDYGRVLALTRETLGPTLERILTAENNERVHSELVHSVAEALPDLMAYLLTAMADVEEERRGLERLEQQLADRVFRFVETMIRLGVTRKAPAYDPDVVTDRLEPILELTDVIRKTQ